VPSGANVSVDWPDHDVTQIAFRGDRPKDAGDPKSWGAFRRPHALPGADLLEANAAHFGVGIRDGVSAIRRFCAIRIAESFDLECLDVIRVACQLPPGRLAGYRPPDARRRPRS
jgi:hypothetical protein